MKKTLTQEQIAFIETYLIQNKVKYWDVRAELIDHIATQVEEKMSMGVSFDAAMMQVHVSFGNRPQKRKLNKENTRWIFETSIYADHSGFERLIKDKQKQLNIGFRKAFGSTVLKIFKQPKYLLFILLYVFGLYYLESLNFTPKQLKLAVFVPILALSLIPMAYSIFFIGKKRQHLGANLLGVYTTFPLHMFNMLSFMPKSFGLEMTTAGWMVVGFFGLVFGITQYKITTNYISKQKAIYNRWKSV